MQRCLDRQNTLLATVKNFHGTFERQSHLTSKTGHFNSFFQIKAFSKPLSGSDLIKTIFVEIGAEIRTPVGLGVSDIRGCGNGLLATGFGVVFSRSEPLMISLILATASVNRTTNGNSQNFADIFDVVTDQWY